MDILSPPRKRQGNFARDIAIAICTTIFGVIGAGIPVWLVYNLWSWCMSQIPATASWAGLAKICVTLLLCLTGGGLIVWAAIVMGALGVAVGAWLAQKAFSKS